MLHAYSMVVLTGFILVPLLAFAALMFRLHSGFDSWAMPEWIRGSRYMTMRQRVRARGADLAVRAIRPLIIVDAVGLLIRGLLAVALRR